MPSNPTAPAAAASWRCRDLTFDLSERALVMGVLNVTPDSFSDGGRYLEPSAAIEHGRRMIAEGADLLDIGAESTRPGAAPVAPEEQWRRLEQVLPGLAAETCVSVDTASAAVAERALDAGARVVNDVSALRDPAMAKRVARHAAGLVLMHMQGSPADMQRDPRYHDVVAEVSGWLAARTLQAVAAGVPQECIVVDPGIGFGKTLAHNLELIARLGAMVAIGRPVLIGVSRKSFIGRLLDGEVDERLEGGLAAAAIAVFEGAAIVRTHDVAPTVRAVRVARALRSARVALAPPSPPVP